MLFGIANPAHLFASKHALLVGVGDYPHAGKLKGPVNDVDSFHRLLRDKLDFPEANIVTLKDAQATKDAILNAIDMLTKRSSSGDTIFILFSGHGVSAHAPEYGSVVHERTSGALVPYDFKEGSDNEMAQRLIIGYRDLRPRFVELEKDKSLFVVFDACYSGSAVRSLNQFEESMSAKTTHVTFRSMPDDKYLPPDAKDPYPYKNTVYFGASSRYQLAYETSQTHDKITRGSLTEALLVGLNGAANSNNDHSISVAELFAFARGHVENTLKMPQTPQILYDSGQSSLLQLAFAKSISVQPACRDQSNSMKIICKGVESNTVEKIRALDNVSVGIANPDEKLSDLSFDVFIESVGSEFKLYNRNKWLLLSMPRNDDDLLQRLKVQQGILALVDVCNPNQSFNVTLDLIGHAGHLPLGESLGFSFDVEEPAHALLLNIDPKGNINIIYPFDETEAAKVSGKKSFKEIAEIKAPVGTEILKLFAFKDKPESYADFYYVNNKEGIEAGTDKFWNLLEMVGSEQNFAQTSLVVMTFDSESDDSF